MKIIALFLLLILSSSRASMGIAVGLSLPEAIERADLIAHVRIDDDQEIIPRFRRSESKDGTVTLCSNSNDPDKYRKHATASVVQPFKASKKGDVIRIRHTNGFGCPNVIYKKGEEYIVFLWKEADSDYFITMNFYAGQFRIEHSNVIAFDLMEGYKHPDDLRLPYERVSSFLLKAIQENMKG